MSAVGLQHNRPEQHTSYINIRGDNTRPVIKIPSLFDGNSDNDCSSDSDNEGPVQTKHVPINNFITVVPKTYSDLLNILLPRLQPRPNIKGVSIEMQQELSHILANELAGHFIIIQHQINDPFLSPTENKELHRCIVVTVCSIIEDLYTLYLTKLSRLHNDNTNMITRLKAELMVQANKSLNIPLIRRNVLQELKGIVQLTHIPSGQRPPSPVAPPTHNINELNQVKLNQPKLRLPPGYIEQVDTDGQRTIINERGVAHYNDITNATTELFTEDYSVSISNDSNISLSSSIDQTIGPVGVSFSAPVLPIMIPPTDKEDDNKIHKSVTVEDIEGLRLGYYGDKETATTKIKLGEYTDEMLREDLMDLVGRNERVKIINNEDDDSMELSPLLAASGMGLSEKKQKSLKQYMSKLHHNEDTTLEEPSHLLTDPLPNIPPLLPNIPPLVPSDVDISQLDHMGNISPSLHSSNGRILSYSNNSLDYSDLQLYDSHNENSFGSNSQHLPSSPSERHSSLSNIDLLVDDEPDLVNISNNNRGLPFINNRGLPFINNDDVIGLQYSNTSGQLYSQSKELPSTFSEPQPDTISFSIPNMDVARASSHRVCERIPQSSLLLQPFPSLYNELTGELDDLTIEKMDAVLQEGDDIKEIYMELSETLIKDHLEVTKDPFLEPCLQEKVKMSSMYASNSLQRRRTLRVINNSLSHSGQPSPWQGISRKEWLNSTQKDGTPQERLASSRRKSSMFYTKLSDIRKRDSKILVESALSLDDYQRLITNQGSDFLGVVHHMYNSSGSDSEDEERERKKREQLRNLHLQLQEKEQKRLEMLKRKTTYVPGQWNANTVLMGGLGKAPDNEEEHKETIEVKEVQVKLETIWERLKVSATDKIDMTIKYSAPDFSTNLPEVLAVWEKSCDAVEKREVALKNLEEYEKYSSSPSRLFSKKSTFRVKEEKTRTILHYKLDAIEKKIIILAKKLRSFDSVLTYQGLNYLEKMSMDRTEMLYFLHQEKRREVLMPSIKLINTQIN